MGCVHGRPSLKSPNERIDKFKRDHGYVKGGSGRKPISQRKLGTRSGKLVEFEGFCYRGWEGTSGGGKVSKENEQKKIGGDELVHGWPKWLVDNVPRDYLAGLVPRSADSYDKLAKVGHGTYSNVYKAPDRDTGKLVAMKKVRFDTSEPESVKFMAREIMVLQKLDHPNVIKLEGLATSRMPYSLYLVFDFLGSDLTRIISRPGMRLTESQIKCYMQQLLSGLRHCHERGILHRDIKGSNLLIDKRGMLKIADFGLANCFSPKSTRPLTNRVVTLWYRAPELLLGSTDYGVGIDLWSAGCLLAQVFVGRPIMPGRTEPSFEEAFRDFPTSSHGLFTTLLDLDPSRRGSAASALQSDFFRSSPLACDLSEPPVVYKDENDPSKTRRRKHTNLRGKPSQASREDHLVEDQTTEQVRGDSEFSKEEATLFLLLSSGLPEVAKSSTLAVGPVEAERFGPVLKPRPHVRVGAGIVSLKMICFSP
ncbi:Protein kinase-like domain-containing protein [Quillaja saponaria]|uniref:Protein kinase-like domain-containing protein n=1 Tax=Quillaja saponaria TaxID=32244 RepID=A0AAD7PIZ4_QUISA|nr:Protein kinase-like domain-containing protein [Quillaja saponaria]